MVDHYKNVVAPLALRWRDTFLGNPGPRTESQHSIGPGNVRSNASIRTLLHWHVQGYPRKRRPQWSSQKRYGNPDFRNWNPAERICRRKSCHSWSRCCRFDLWLSRRHKGRDASKGLKWMQAPISDSWPYRSRLTGNKLVCGSGDGLWPFQFTCISVPYLRSRTRITSPTPSPCP